MNSEILTNGVSSIQSIQSGIPTQHLTYGVLNMSSSIVSITDAKTKSDAWIASLQAVVEMKSAMDLSLEKGECHKHHVDAYEKAKQRQKQARIELDGLLNAKSPQTMTIYTNSADDRLITP